jgi:anti-sigma-K factor RskA
MPPEQLDCSAVDELLHAYAADVLDGEERALVEEHLAGCALHEDVEAWRDVSLRLAELAPVMAPPVGLRDRILAIPATSAATAAAASAVAEARDVAPTPIAREAQRDAVPRSATRSQRWAYALAAVFAVIALSFAGWTAVLLTNDEDAASVLSASASAGGIETSAVYVGDERVAVVRLDGLDTLESGRDYQLWTIAPGGSPVSAGVVRQQDGSAVAAVPGEFGTGWTFAVTVEPAGGSQQPTSEPISAVTF